MKKQKAQIEQYIEEHGVMNALNDALNYVLIERPTDPYSILADLLEERSGSATGVLDLVCVPLYTGIDAYNFLLLVRTKAGDSTLEFEFSEAPRDEAQLLEVFNKVLRASIYKVDPRDTYSIDEKVTNWIESSALKSSKLEISLVASFVLFKAGCKIGKISSMHGFKKLVKHSQGKKSLPKLCWSLNINPYLASSSGLMKHVYLVFPKKESLEQQRTVCKSYTEDFIKKVDADNKLGVNEVAVDPIQTEQGGDVAWKSTQECLCICSELLAKVNKGRKDHVKLGFKLKEFEKAAEVHDQITELFVKISELDCVAFIVDNTLEDDYATRQLILKTLDINDKSDVLICSRGQTLSEDKTDLPGEVLLNPEDFNSVSGLATFMEEANKSEVGINLEWGMGSFRFSSFVLMLLGASPELLLLSDTRDDFIKKIQVWQTKNADMLDGRFLF